MGWGPGPPGVGGVLTILGVPLLALPGNELDARGQRLVNAFPVNAPIAGLGHIGEDGILLDGLDGIGVCLHRGSRSDTKKPVLWVDGPQVTWKVLNQVVEVNTKQSITYILISCQANFCTKFSSLLFLSSSLESISLFSSQHYQSTLTLSSSPVSHQAIFFF